MKIEKKTLNFEFGAERVNRHMYNDYSLPFFPKVEDFAIETRERLLFVSSTKNFRDTISNTDTIISCLSSHIWYLLSRIFLSCISHFYRADIAFLISHIAFFVLHLAFSILPLAFSVLHIAFSISNLALTFIVFFFHLVKVATPMSLKGFRNLALSL